MPKDQVWKIISFFHTNRLINIFLYSQAGKWPNVFTYLYRLRRNPAKCCWQRWTK